MYVKRVCLAVLYLRILAIRNTVCVEESGRTLDFVWCTQAGPIFCSHLYFSAG